MDQHHTELQLWSAGRVSEVFSLPEVEHSALLAHWSEVAGDASLRRYYRIATSDISVIVMDSSADSEASAEFVRIAEIMRHAGVRVPRIYSADLEQGYLLLEDFGDQLLKSQLQPENGQALFDVVLPVLLQIASSACDELPAFSVQRLDEELDLFTEWYLQHHRGCALNAEEQLVWQKIKQMLIESAQAQPQVAVHRDFHSCNLLRLAGGEIGVIDFQDAVRGPLTYDLASWLWDRYLAWPRTDIERWIEQAREPLCEQLQVIIDPEVWLQYCDWMGLQRNIKIVGIFARLHYRDGKAGYLEMIDRFAAYILDLLPCYAELSFAEPLFKKYLDNE